MKNEFTYFPHEKLFHVHLDYGCTVVDQDGFDVASSYSGTWCSERGKYAILTDRWKTVRLHRAIMNAPVFYLVDHINGDGLDNRKFNLRLATESQNLAKSKLLSTNTSGYRGVYFNSGVKKWHAQIKFEGKRINLGLHTNKEDAALAYNEAARKYFKEFAFQNVIKQNK